MEEKETKASDEKSIKQTIDEEKIQKTQDTIAEIKSKVDEILQQKQNKEDTIAEIKSKVDEILQQKQKKKNKKKKRKN
jgi:hypothetical protein